MALFYFSLRCIRLAATHLRSFVVFRGSWSLFGPILTSGYHGLGSTILTSTDHQDLFSSANCLQSCVLMCVLMFVYSDPIVSFGVLVSVNLTVNLQKYRLYLSHRISPKASTTRVCIRRARTCKTSSLILLADLQ